MDGWQLSVTYSEFHDMSCVSLQVCVGSRSPLMFRCQSYYKQTFVCENIQKLQITSHQCGPEVFMRSTHRGSDLEKWSLSSRFWQETLRATLVTHSVGFGPWGTNDAIANLEEKVWPTGRQLNDKTYCNFTLPGGGISLILTTRQR